MEEETKAKNNIRIKKTCTPEKNIKFAGSAPLWESVEGLLKGLNYGPNILITISLMLLLSFQVMRRKRFCVILVNTI